MNSFMWHTEKSVHWTIVNWQVKKKVVYENESGIYVQVIETSYVSNAEPSPIILSLHLHIEWL